MGKYKYELVLKNKKGLEEFKNVFNYNEHILATLLLSPSLTPKELGELYKFVFSNINNHQLDNYIEISIINKDKNRIFSPRYEIFNCVKQLILFTQSTKGVSTFYGAKRVLEDVIPFEKRKKKLFLYFTKDEIEELRKFFLEKYTAETVTTKFSYLSKLSLTINNILKDVGLDSYNNGWSRKTQKVVRKRKINIIFYNELISKILAKYPTPDNIIPLLIFKGVSVTRKVENSELSHLKIRDYKNGCLTVHGQYGDRKIKFTPKEKEYMDRAISNLRITGGQLDNSKNKIAVTDDSYIMLPKRIITTPIPPLSKWVIDKRLSEIATEIYGDKTYLNKESIYTSGQLDYINNWLMDRYGTPDVDDLQAVEKAIFSLFKAFGMYSQEDLELGEKQMDDFWHDRKDKEQGKVYKATKRITALRKQLMNKINQ